MAAVCDTGPEPGLRSPHPCIERDQHSRTKASKAPRRSISQPLVAGIWSSAARWGRSAVATDIACWDASSRVVPRRGRSSGTWPTPPGRGRHSSALDAQVHSALDVHIIMDNYGTHKSALIRRRSPMTDALHMSTSRRRTLVAEPPSAGRHESRTASAPVRALHPQRAGPDRPSTSCMDCPQRRRAAVQWTKSADDILAGIKRFAQRTLRVLRDDLSSRWFRNGTLAPQRVLTPSSVDAQLLPTGRSRNSVELREAVGRDLCDLRRHGAGEETQDRQHDESSRLVSMDCGRCHSGPFFTSGTVGLIEQSSLFHGA